VSTDPEEDFAAAMTREVAIVNERIANCHEVVTCPTCWAPVGVKCRAMPQGYVIGARGLMLGRELKHPHEARWTRVQPKR
jgi:hypothetical protein